jgi:hypothetical protein
METNPTENDNNETLYIVKMKECIGGDTIHARKLWQPSAFKPLFKLPFHPHAIKIFDELDKEEIINRKNDNFKSKFTDEK